MKLCVNGHQMDDNAKFCPYCGAPAQPEVPVQPVQQPETPVQVEAPMQGSYSSAPVQGTYSSAPVQSEVFVQSEAPVQPQVEAPVQPQVEAPVQSQSDAFVQPQVEAPVQPQVEAPVQSEAFVQAEAPVQSEAYAQPEPSIQQQPLEQTQPLGQISPMPQQQAGGYGDYQAQQPTGGYGDYQAQQPTGGYGDYQAQQPTGGYGDYQYQQSTEGYGNYQAQQQTSGYGNFQPQQPGQGYGGYQAAPGNNLYQQQTQPPYNGNGKPVKKKKKKTGLVIVLLVLILLIGAACGLLFVPMSPLNILNGGFQEVLHIRENYKTNKEDNTSKDSLDVEDGYLPLETTINDVDLSFLYPDDASADAGKDKVTIKLATDATIYVTAESETVYSLKRYFARFESETKDKADVDEVGDIQKVDVGDKTLYRMSIDITKSGSKLKCDRYIESYGKYYVQYTVVSSDGAEGTLRHIISSLRVSKNAYKESTEKTTEQSTEKKSTEKKSTEKKSTESQSQKPSSNGDMDKVTYGGVDFVYPKNIVTSVDQDSSGVELSFGDEDFLLIMDAGTGYADAKAALEDYQKQVDSRLAGADYQVTKGNVTTTSSGQGDPVYYFKYGMKDDEDDIQLYCVAVQCKSSKHVWILYGCVETSNEQNMINVINTILNNTVFK